MLSPRKRLSNFPFIDDREQQPDAKARQVFQELVFGKHPAGRPALGTRKSVEPLTREDCVAFHKTDFLCQTTRSWP